MGLGTPVRFGAEPRSQQQLGAVTHPGLFGSEVIEAYRPGRRLTCILGVGNPQRPRAGVYVSFLPMGSPWLGGEEELSGLRIRPPCCLAQAHSAPSTSRRACPGLRGEC